MAEGTGSFHDEVMRGVAKKIIGEQMPSLRAGTSDIAVCCADLHLSHNVPKARAETRDEWYRCQATYLKRLEWVANGKPILVAGDLLHSWDEPPELINFLIRNMPQVYAIPGNHELPDHSYANVKRSAYWTLVEAGKVIDCVGPRPFGTGHWNYLHGATEGTPPPKELVTNEKYGKKKYGKNILLLHKYLHTERTAHPGAQPQDHWQEYAAKQCLDKFDLVIVGDNHRAWYEYYRKTKILNCGLFQRRKSDERGTSLYVPCVYIIDQSLTPHSIYLNTATDKWREVEDAPEPDVETIDSAELVEALNELGADAMDFGRAVIREMRRLGTKPGVKKLIDLILKKAKDAK